MAPRLRYWGGGLLNRSSVKTAVDVTLRPRKYTPFISTRRGLLKLFFSPGIQTPSGSPSAATTTIASNGRKRRVAKTRWTTSGDACALTKRIRSTTIALAHLRVTRLLAIICPMRLSSAKRRHIYTFQTSGWRANATFSASSWRTADRTPANRTRTSKCASAEKSLPTTTALVAVRELCSIVVLCVRVCGPRLLSSHRNRNRFVIVFRWHTSGGVDIFDDFGSHFYAKQLRPQLDRLDFVVKPKDKHTPSLICNF